MQLSFYGASETVTGSKSVLEIGTKRVLIDCGMYQGNHALEELNSKSLTSLFGPIDYVFLTHAHLDHTGLLPKLIHEGFHGKIYCTKETFALVRIILEDCVRIQLSELKDGKLSELIYNEMDVEKTLSLMSTVELNSKVEIDEFTVEFLSAGHILGAMSVIFESSDKRICFSGDIGRSEDLIHTAPKVPKQLDYLVLETTYGDRNHDKKNPYKDLILSIEKIKQSKGVLLIPAFAVARTQILVKMLADLFEIAPNLKLPIFVDSPMAVKTTKVYQDYSDSLKVKKDDFETTLKVARFVEFGNDAKKLARQKAPFILISSSGMLTGGRIMKYVDMYAHHERNVILLTGFQGEGTLGRSILDGERDFKIFGHKLKVRADVKQVSSLSAHADQEELTNYVKEIKGLKKVFLNHGEKEAIKRFREKLSTKIESAVIIAEKGKVFKL